MDLPVYVEGASQNNTKELNKMLDAEADQLTNAGKYERTEGRKDTCAGHYQRKLTTKAGEVTLNVPKLRHLPFETAIIERYKRRESSIEEALIEMYLAGVSVRRIEDITEVLWGSKVSAGTISEMNKKVYGHIEEWRNRELKSTYPLCLLWRYLSKALLGRFIRQCSHIGGLGSR